MEDRSGMGGKTTPDPCTGESQQKLSKIKNQEKQRCVNASTTEESPPPDESARPGSCGSVDRTSAGGLKGPGFDACQGHVCWL